MFQAAHPTKGVHKNPHEILSEDKSATYFITYVFLVLTLASGVTAHLNMIVFGFNINVLAYIGDE